MNTDRHPTTSSAHTSRPALPGRSRREAGRTNWLDDVCRRIVLSNLEKMTEGCLRLQMPDGTWIAFGDATSRRRATISIKCASFFTRCVLFGHIGFAESYLDGQWETDDLDAVISWFLLNLNSSTVLEGSAGKSGSINILSALNQLRHCMRANTPANSRRNIRDHYDLSNEFFKLFLDESLTYSCAFFETGAETLYEAQTAKYDRMCKKLRLNQSDRVLEIGCGWGSFCIHAASRYGCRIEAITISQQQYDLARQRVHKAGVADRVQVELVDYRDVTGQFDKIVSIEMLEAVGDKYMEAFFARCSGLLSPQGLLGLQTITCPDSRYKLLLDNTDFIQKHIFPGGQLPSLARITEAMKRTGELFLYELEDMGNSYVKTLDRWQSNFNLSVSRVRELGFDERFIRKWNYYLSYCKAAFAMRNITVVQAVYTKPNNYSLSEAPTI